MSEASLRTSGKPWFREPWPWILMAGPAMVIVAGAITVSLAIKSDDGLVADDYYKRGLAVNQDIGRDRKAAELGLKASVAFGDDRQTLKVQVEHNSSAPLPPSVNLALVHPTRRGQDQVVPLSLDGKGTYVGMLKEPIVQASGKRHLALEDPEASWRLVGEWDTDTLAANLQSEPQK
ncbi:FixH family protein [Oryzomicrobium sp.]|uniref:FixH family protein n=1 Tax=Oryzomicrobium sp. TaxID=1911578 RepID=UPI002FE3353B